MKMKINEKEIYDLAYGVVMNIPFNGNVIIYSDQKVEYIKNEDLFTHNYKENNAHPILSFDLNKSYWNDFFNEYDVDINELYGGAYEALMSVIANEYSIMIKEALSDYN